MRTGGNTEKLKVGLVQINNSFSGQNYLPLSVGLLQAHVQGHAKTPGRYEFLLPIFSRRPVKTMVEQLSGANVVAFSTYVWNINISLEVARKIKQESPNTMVVFGGPQVPDRAEAFLRKYPYIDLVCHGEGEQVFLSILERFPFGSWEDVPSISYVHQDGSFHNHVKAARIKELSLVPSPFLNGVFEPLVEANPHEEWLVLWETNRGCPFSCTFCDWGSSVASKVYTFDIERLYKEIEWFAEHKIEFVFCCDANFGILPRDLDIAQHVAKVKLASGYPHALSVQNTKNATDRAYNVQKTLADAGLNKGVTISFQSIDPKTLKNVKRQNISSESFQELQHRFTRDKVETYTDLILGLPGETYDSFADGVSTIIENGQHNRIQFNNLSILPNAEMGDPEYQRKYGMVTVESKIWNIHGSLEELEEEVSETQELVIATSAMPKEDWVRARVFCWMTGLLHFDKVLQIPLVLLHETCAMQYRELIESFLGMEPDEFAVLSRIRSFFVEKAREIQTGGPEYCLSKEWLNIGWPADEYILIELCTRGELDAFYVEAERLLSKLLRARFIDLPPDLLHEAVQLNKQLLRLPFQVEDLDVAASYNVLGFYLSALGGEPIPLERHEITYHVNRTKVAYSSWDTWCREVIWYGNKRGAYLYGNDSVTPQLAGHH
jgi:radical SAM superfamily enzyme YgiQ (UPF0313 family)